jgi:hypothetical protein
MLLDIRASVKEADVLFIGAAVFDTGDDLSCRTDTDRAFATVFE